ncbi:MerR family mercuric resistance operon transcriptional regulator [Rhizobium alvei]
MILTIAKLAAAGGVGVETIRYYQRRGLLVEPDRPAGDGPAGGIRRYGKEDLRRLRFIRAAQTAGFSLEEIAELLALDSGQDHHRARELAQTRLQALEEKIADLERARSSLQRLSQACRENAGGPCPIIEAFEHPIAD